MQIKSGRILDILWAFLIKQLLAKKHSSSSKKTSRWTTSAIGRMFAELNNPLSLKLVDKHACTIEYELNIDGGKHVFACFKLEMILNE